MKYSEFFKLAKRKGWQLLRQGKGSREIWEKGEQKSSNSKSWFKRNAERIREKFKKRNGILKLHFL
jgi:hypothetical protein